MEGKKLRKRGKEVKFHKSENKKRENIEALYKRLKRSCKNVFSKPTIYVTRRRKKMVRCIFQIGLEYAPFGVRKHLQLLRQMVMKNDLLPYKLLSKIQSQACYRYKKRVKEK